MSAPTDERQLLAAILRMLVIPGGSVVLETLPNGQTGIGFRWTRPPGN